VINVLESLSTKLDRLDDAELESYIIAVHGMKSALASIGEKELSGIAYRLEQAGVNRDFNLIVNETPAFFNSVSSLVETLQSAEANDSVDISHEDMVFLRGKLDDIKTACGSFNINAAKRALADLKKKTWSQMINDSYDEISVGLLRGEFKKVAAVIEKIEEVMP